MIGNQPDTYRYIGGQINRQIGRQTNRYTEIDRQKYKRKDRRTREMDIEII